MARLTLRCLVPRWTPPTYHALVGGSLVNHEQWPQQLQYQYQQTRPSRWSSVLLGGTQQTSDVPPNYPARPSTLQLGSRQFQDTFSYLADYKQAQPYVHAEQLHYKQAVRSWGPLAQQLAAEVKQHLASAQGDRPAEVGGGYMYGSHHNLHGEDTIWRSPAAAPAQQQMLLSEEVLQQDLAFLTRLTGITIQAPKLADVKLSADHALLAYSVECGLADQQPACCIVKEIDAGRVMPHMVLSNVSTFAWAADTSCLYYAVPDAAGRPSKVFRRSMQPSSSGGDELVYDDPDPRHFVSLTTTRDQRYVIINSHSKLSSEVHLLDGLDSQAFPLCVQPRSPGLEYFVEHQAGHLLLLANRSTAPGFNPEPTAEAAHASAPANSPAADAEVQDYSLFTVPVAALHPGSAAHGQPWLLQVAESPGVAITDIEVFDGVAVLHELRGGQPAVRLLHLEAQPGKPLSISKQQQVCMPHWALDLQPGINADFHASSMRVYLSSPVQPELAFDITLATGDIAPAAVTNAGQLSGNTAAADQQQQHQQQQPGILRQGLQDSSRKHQCAGSAGMQAMSARKVWARAADGVQVPMTLLQPGDMVSGSSGPRPVLVEVYGAYGDVLRADCKPHWVPLLQRGWSVALAHVRGGGELGRRWHAAGRQLHKRSSVLDLLSCMDYLVQEGITQPGLITGHATSAGGLTLAAAVNVRPDWFAAVVLEAPFVDWVAGCGAVTESGHSLVGQHVLTEHEADEWGDPWRNADVAELVCSLCPYTNLQPSSGRPYPAMLLTAGLQDSRVPYWMPLKYVAKLRNLSSEGSDCAAAAGACAHQQPRPVLLDIVEDGGHFSQGVSGRCLDDIAMQLAFLLQHAPCAPS